MIELYFDGACEPFNPKGNGSIGVIVKENKRTIFSISQFIGSGEGMSNNVAEYAALLKGLEFLKEQALNEKEIRVFGDSNLVIEQMKGNWKIKKGMYAEIALKCLTLSKEFKKIIFSWIPRELNEQADYLSKNYEIVKCA